MTAAAPIRPAEPAARGRGRRSLRRVFTRYTIGSVAAAAASEAVLLAAYGTGLLGPRAASVAAWTAGAAVNYLLNRWAWGRRGRVDPLRELLPYWLIALATMALSAWATGVADDRVGGPAESGWLRTALVGGVFAAVYGVMFVVKFVLFHYLVFADGPRRLRPARRSRHQVPNTTRE
ncbi:MAG: GtrA family protein [Actinomadura rubrobrunea]|nr:GtrA family protein [Actinomadura rubrobrunea]